MRTSILLLLLATSASARADDAAVRVLALRGAAHLDTGESQLEVVRGMAIEPPVTVVTGAESALRLRLADGSIVKLGASTRMTLDRFDHEKMRRRRATMKLTVGRMWAKVTGWLGGSTRYDVETPNAVAGVRGTEFVVTFDEAGLTSVLVVDGNVAMQDAAGNLTEQIGPSFAGLFSGEGEISVRELAAEELEIAAADVRIGPQLSDDELAALAKRKRSGDDTGDETRPLPFGLRPEDAPPPADLPLEPGVGQSRSFGRLEVRDD